MSVTVQDYQGLIIASLAAADPSALADLTRNVPLYWRLHARVAIPELQFWYTRRDGIRLLMACNVRATDYLRRTQTGARQTVESSHQDSTMSGSSVEDSGSVSDRNSASHYDDETNSSETGTSSSNRLSTQHSESASTMADTGHGASATARTMTQVTHTTERGNVQTVETDQMTATRTRAGTGYRSMGMVQDPPQYDLSVFADTFTFTLTIPPWHLDLPLFGPVNFNALHIPITLPIPFDFSVTNYTHGNSYQHQEMPNDDIDSARDQTGDINILTQPKRESHVTVHDHSTVHNDFQAAVTETETASATAVSNASSSANSSGTMTGAGSGSSSMTGSSSSFLTASGSRTSHGDGISTRSNTANSELDSRMERLHQKFLHLQELWKRATEMIEWLESQRLGLPAYVMTQILIQYPDGCDAAVANALLVQQPQYSGGLR